LRKPKWTFLIVAQFQRDEQGTLSAPLMHMTNLAKMMDNVYSEIKRRRAMPFGVPASAGATIELHLTSPNLSTRVVASVASRGLPLFDPDAEWRELPPNATGKFERPL
jgi:hypothetical protein